MAKFAFSTLFQSAAIAAALDDLIARDAQQGRVNYQFAQLVGLEYGIALTTKAGHPINKPAFLKLRGEYAAVHGKGMVTGRNKRAAFGAALDCIALGLMLGQDWEDADKVQALKDSGQYIGDAAAWLALIPAPVKATKGDKPAPKVGEPSPVALDKHAPSVAEAQQAGAVTVTQGAEAQALADAQQGAESPAEATESPAEPAATVAEAEALPEVGDVVEISAADALAAVISCLQLQVYTAADLATLADALAAAQGAMLAEQAMQAARDKAEEPALV